jgi:predicted nucleotidyltransferase
MDPLIEKHREKIREIAARYRLTGVRVFGSMARGDADEQSDVDLLVTLPQGVSGLALGGLLADVQELVGRKVDVLTERGLHPALRERVLKEAQPL